MNKYYVFFVALLTFIVNSSGLYFHIAETERKCFIEEIPDETTVIGNFSFFCHLHTFFEILTFILIFLVNYKVELYDPRSGGFMPSAPGEY